MNCAGTIQNPDALFICAKAKRQRQMFSVAKAKRQLQLRQGEIDLIKEGLLHGRAIKAIRARSTC
ncbi:hypothetical protein [Lysinibacillus sp. NPDC056232]|uniref:hypothetical protein n=1 Tax=Lysinibacillus sp. NPDC056232 TaxID=3345756 RepID=UPI0035E1DFEE